MRFRWSSVSATVHSGRIVANFSVMRRPAVRAGWRSSRSTSAASRGDILATMPSRWRCVRCSSRNVTSSAGSRSSSAPSLDGEVRCRTRRSVSPFNSESTAAPCSAGSTSKSTTRSSRGRSSSSSARSAGWMFATAAASSFGLSRISSSMSGPITLARDMAGGFCHSTGEGGRKKPRSVDAVDGLPTGRSRRPSYPGSGRRPFPGRSDNSAARRSGSRARRPWPRRS